VEASKREGQKQMWWLAFHWEVITYHTSTRLQHITLAHLWWKDIHCFSLNGLKQGSGWGRCFYLLLDLFPGFLYHSLLLLLLLFIIPYDHFGGVI
jgi:hypothetical protein